MGQATHDPPVRAGEGFAVKIEIFEPKLKDRITPHVNFFQKDTKEKVKSKRERLGRDEVEIELGMCVDVCECTYVCVCMYVWCELCLSEMCVCV